MSNTPKNSYFYQGQQKAQPPGSHAGAGSPNPKGSSKSMEPVKFTVVQGQDAYYGNAPPKPQKVAPRPHDGAPSTSSARRHGPPPPGPGSDAAFNPSSQGQIPSYSYTSPPNISSGQPNHFGLVRRYRWYLLEGGLTMLPRTTRSRCASRRIGG